MKFITTLLAFPAFVATASTSAAFQTATTRVSVDSTGAQGNGSSGSYGFAISADGRFVAFSSTADNLVTGDTNGTYDVFVHDRQSGTTERVSVDSSAVQGNTDSYNPSISADGRFVAFESTASNLVTSDTNGTLDAFVRDRQNGITERVSVSSTGAQGIGQFGSGDPSISADGRFVAFESYATNLVAGDTNGWSDIFVRDRQSGTTELASVATNGTQGNRHSQSPQISANGRFVAFESNAYNLVTGDSNLTHDIFVRDRQSGTTERVSVDSAGAQGNDLSGFPAITGDGRYVAFSSWATQLVTGDSNGKPDIFVHDRQSGTTQRVSVSATGAQGNDDSYWPPSISADGRNVGFSSGASNLVTGDTNGTYDVFVHDRQSGTTERVSVDSAGAQANNYSGYYGPSISANVRFVAFTGSASNLVTGDTNGVWDVFVRDRGPQPVSYCTAGTTTHGCAAQIELSATPSVSLANACAITVSNLEGQKSGILFYGIDNTGFTPWPWASGSTSLLCVKHPTQRTPIQSSGGLSGMCDGSFALDWNAYQTVHPLALGNPWSVGDKVYVQAWFRDPLAVKSTNLSNAVEMTYGP